jgi:hypothetical protein
MSEQFSLVQELRDYPAIDPCNVIIAIDHLEDGYCIVPRTTVLQAAARIEELEGVLREIVKANDDFRGGMPDEWEGDPLQDACEAARKALSSADRG